MPTDPLSRREMLLVTAAAAGGSLLAATTADAQSPTAGDNANTSTLGPKNLPMDEENRSAALPPPTDKGDVNPFKYSFALAHKKTTAAGWARQVTKKELPIAKDLAGVNMRLTTGGVRELHWHQSGEWSYMLAGKARLTAIDAQGKSFVGDLEEGDLWYFPSGIPHSIQGLGPEGCEFLLVFDDGGSPSTRRF